MKVLALALSTILSTLIISASSLVVILAVPHLPDALSLTVPAVLSAIIYGALALGSVLTYFDPKRSQPSMTAFRRWAIGIVAVDVAALVALFIVTAAFAAPLWIPLSFAGIGIVTLVIAVLVGNALRRYDQRQDHRLPKWSPVSRAQITRKVVKIVVTFVAAFVLVFAVEIVLTAIFGKKANIGIGTDLVFALIFAFIASGAACLLVTIPLSRHLRMSLNRDLGLTRKFARIVVRGKKDELSDEERVPAARYASVVSITLPFSLAYIVLLYAGLGTLMIEEVSFNRFDQIFHDIFLVFLIVVLVGIVPMQILRIRRARRYVREHEDLLEEEPAAVR